MHQREEQGSGEQGVEVRGREVPGKAMTSGGGAEMDATAPNCPPSQGGVLGDCGRRIKSQGW